MRRYTSDDLRTFLTAIDANLRQKVRITVIGGGAIALAHGVDRNTTDIDTLDNQTDALRSAIRKARSDTGLDIPLAPARVSDVPWHSDQRMIRVLKELEKLEVWALEAHDVALSKTVRGHENDFAAIKKLHEKVALDQATLVERWLTEMTHVIGKRQRIDQNFELLIERLFGEIAAEEVHELLEQRRRSSDL